MSRDHRSLALATALIVALAAAIALSRRPARSGDAIITPSRDHVAVEAQFIVSSADSEVGRTSQLVKSTAEKPAGEVAPAQAETGKGQVTDSSAAKVMIGPPPRPASRGDIFWSRIFGKFGSLDQREYARLAREYRLKLHKECSRVADEMLTRQGPGFDEFIVLGQDDADLRDRFGSTINLLSMGGSSQDHGQYKAFVAPDAHPSVYEIYWDMTWLQSAAAGNPLHLE